MIAGHLSIADGVMISADGRRADRCAGRTGFFPMMPHREWKHVAVALRRMGSFSDRLKALERAASGDKKGEDGE
jgi:UDP-3-O-[3-hydroxymyristoyl] glucosamine N-acyltransferase